MTRRDATPDDPEPLELGEAAEVYAGYLETVERGDGPDFETFVAEHPALAASLRRLHAQLRTLGLPATPSPPPVFGLELHALDEQRYEDRGELAAGGMGEIRRIWDRHLRRDLVLKRLARRRRSWRSRAPAEPVPARGAGDGAARPSGRGPRARPGRRRRRPAVPS